MNQIIVAPIEALTDNEITETERRVLLILFSFRNKSTDTVWPSTTAIAQMANISDVPRISKITSSLADKGWLTKKKKGFTGCNEYVLTFPERLNSDSNLANFTKLVENTKNEESTNLDENANTNLANFTKSNLANFTKYKEHTNEQTIEQTNIKKNKSKKVLDYSCWPDMPSEQTMTDWTAMRKRLKADISQTVINRFAKELHKAKKFGYSVDDCLTECVTRNWRGFECQWLLNSGGHHGSNQQRGSTGTRFGKVGHSDQTRADARQALERLNGSDGNSVVHSTC